MTATRYDHVKEAEMHYANASEYRRRAHMIRAEAEDRARGLEAAATGEVQRGLHIHRLCTSGSAFACCCPPTSATGVVEDPKPLRPREG